MGHPDEANAPACNFQVSLITTAVNIVWYVDLIPCGSGRSCSTVGRTCLVKRIGTRKPLSWKNVRDLQRQTGFVRSTTSLMMDGVDGKDTT